MPRLKLSYRLATFAALTVTLVSLASAGSTASGHSFVDSVKELFGIQPTQIVVLSEKPTDDGPLVPLADQTWDGGTTGTGTAWFTLTNWAGDAAFAGSSTGVTTNTDVATIPSTGTNPAIGIDMATLTGGTLYLGAINYTGANRTIGAGSATSGTLRLNGATVNGVANVIIRNSGTGNLTLQNNGGGSGAMGIGLGNAVDNIVNIDSTGGVTISNVISGPGMKLTNAGAGPGVVTLSGLNTYTGATTLRGGIISVSTIRDGGVVGGLGQATNAAANLVFDGGTLRYTGSTASTNRNFTINPGKTATIGVSVTGDLTLSGASTATTGGLTKIDTGLLFLSGTNLYSGSTTISAGSLALTGGGSIANSPVIEIQGGAYFDVSSLTTALTLPNGQAIRASGTTTTGKIATVVGKGLTTASDSPLQFTAFNGATAPLTIQGSGTVTLAIGNPVTVNTTTVLGAGDYPLIAKGTSGTVAGTAPTSLTIGGSGLAAGTVASLQITGSQLVLRVVAAPPTLQFSSSNPTGSEAGPITVTVTRAGSSANTVSVGYETLGGGGACIAGADFIEVSGTLTFVAGDNSETFDIPTCDDNIYEGTTEGFQARLINPSGATLGIPNDVIFNINENDLVPSVHFSSATYTNSDDLSLNTGKVAPLAPQIATITATRSGAAGNAFSVNYATATGGTATVGANCGTGSGVDYVSTSGTLDFAAGDTNKTFNITVCTDNRYEGDETVNLALTSPTAPATLGTPATSVLTITDNDSQPALQFSSATYLNSDDIAKFGVTTEELTAVGAIITVNRTGAVDNSVTVDYTTGGGTATAGASCTAGVDYVTAGGTLSFAAGVISQTFNVPVCTDVLFEGDETVNLTLSNPTGSAALGTPNSSVLTIIDNDPAPTTATNLSAPETYTEDTTLNLTDIVVSDPDSANVTATLTLSNTSAGSLTTATSGPVTSTYSAGVWSASGAIASVNALLAGVSFVPATNFNGSFTIGTSVTDSVDAPATGSKAMTGIAVNDPPVAVDDNRTTTQDVALVVTGASLVSNDTDPDGPGLSVTAVSNPVNGTVGLSAGTVTFTPNAGFSGSASFEYTVSDGSLSDTGVVYVTVTSSDTTPPVVTYTPIPNESLNPTLSVTATDAVGVTGVTIFWSINGGVYNSAVCSSGATWTCAIAGMSGASSVAYYVAAQDAAANTSTDPVGGVASPNLFTFGPATVPAGTYENAIFGGGVILGGNITVNGSLTLNGIVTTGANKISVACGVPVNGVGPASYVVGNFERFFCGVETFTFPVGGPILPPFSPARVVDSNYSPLTAQITAVDVNSSLTVSVTDDFLPGSQTSFSASRYWLITENGTLTADLNFAYLDQDISGDENTYRILRRSGSTIAVYLNGTVNPATNSVNANAVTDFSGWAAGNLSPTAANVSLGGRILTADGLGVTNAIVVVSGNSLATPIRAVTGPFGYYQFDGLAVGETYVVTINSKRFRFTVSSRVITLSDSVQDVDFTADPLE